MVSAQRCGKPAASGFEASLCGCTAKIKKEKRKENERFMTVKRSKNLRKKKKKMPFLRA